MTTPIVYKGNWSFSMLMQYEACPLRVKFKRVDRIPELPLPPDNPLERGNREHKRYEQFVKGEIATLDGAEGRAHKAFLPLLEHARTLHAAGMATTEEDWILNSDWGFCERNEAWLWMKLDLHVSDEANAHVIEIDYKTGRSQYKGYEHIQQLQLYAATSALKHPWAHKVTTELWYVDEGHVKSFTYTREQALTFIGRFQARADAIYADRHFRANPNKQTCRYCPYGPQTGNWHCPVGV